MRFLLGLWLVVVFISCSNDKKSVDVSGIKVDLVTHRFEKDLFALDSISFKTKMDQVIAKYPAFGENFVSTILSSDMKWPADSINSYVWTFVKSYRPVFDTAMKVFPDFSSYEKEI